MSNTLDLAREAIALAEELRREFSDPPLCRVCGEHLECGSSENGGKWAHYVRGEGFYDEVAMDHTNRSILWRPKPDARVVAVCSTLLSRDAEVARLREALVEARGWIYRQPATMSNGFVLIAIDAALRDGEAKP